jgi:hypothetical protein
MQRCNLSNLMQGQLLRKPIISLYIRRRPAGIVGLQLSKPDAVPRMGAFMQYPTFRPILLAEQYLMIPMKMEYRTRRH